MSNSTHKCEVFRLTGLTKNPNADSLWVGSFYNYPFQVNAELKEGDLAVYIPPDSIVPDEPQFAFLGSHKRIKAKKLRGVVSMGLVIPAPKGSKEGEDVAEKLGITHYVPKINTGRYGTGTHSKKFLKYSSFIKGPAIEGPYYDIESWWRYGFVFEEGELVEVTEKIHGTNARFTYQGGRMWVASRSGYRNSRRYLKWWQRWADRLGLIEIEPDTVYWKVLEQQPWIQRMCMAHPGFVFYGEIFGDVQELKYGAKDGQLFFRLFDTFNGKQYLDANRNVHNPEVNVPLIYKGPYLKEHFKSLISGPSLIEGAGHYREGIVIKPQIEGFAYHLGRKILKAVSPEYLEKAK